MPIEIKILAWAALLLVAHIFSAVLLKTAQYGADWNMGARDEAVPPMSPLVGRLTRAQANYLETLPIALIALGGVVMTGKADAMTALGGWIWLGARAVYLPLYAFGVPKVRTLAYLVSLAGLGMALRPLLIG